MLTCNRCPVGLHCQVLVSAGGCTSYMGRDLEELVTASDHIISDAHLFNQMVPQVLAH